MANPRNLSSLLHTDTRTLSTIYKDFDINPETHSICFKSHAFNINKIPLLRIHNELTFQEAVKALSPIIKLRYQVEWCFLDNGELIVKPIDGEDKGALFGIMILLEARNVSFEKKLIEHLEYLSSKSVHQLEKNASSSVTLTSTPQSQFSHTESKLTLADLLKNSFSKLPKAFQNALQQLYENPPLCGTLNDARDAWDSNKEKTRVALLYLVNKAHLGNNLSLLDDKAPQFYQIDVNADSWKNSANRKNLLVEYATRIASQTKKLT